MALRAEWKAAKDQSLTKFKQEFPIKPDVSIPPVGYPFAFKQDLGPTLDSYEKEKDSSKQRQHAQKAKRVIASYKQQIEHATVKTGKDTNMAMKDKESAKILLRALTSIDGKVR